MNEIDALLRDLKKYGTAGRDCALSAEDALAIVAALEAAREDAGDAARYRWLCDGKGYFMEEAGLCHIDNEKPEADAAIDKAMRGEW